MTANSTIVHLVELSLDLVYSPPVMTVFPWNIASYTRKQASVRRVTRALSSSALQKVRGCVTTLYLMKINTSLTSFVMVMVDNSGILGRRPLLVGAHSSWSWLTSLVFSADGHFSLAPIRHGRGWHLWCSRQMVTSLWSPFVMVVVNISGVLGRWSLLSEAHSSWSW